MEMELLTDGLVVRGAGDDGYITSRSTMRCPKFDLLAI